MFTTEDRCTFLFNARGEISVRKIISIAIILLIISSVYVFSSLYDSNKATPSVDQLAYSSDLQVKVNGEQITSSDVDAQYEKIPANTRQNITKDQVLESLITQKLLLQEVEKKGINSTEKDVDIYLGKAQNMSGLDDVSFRHQITASGYSIEEYRKNIRNLIEVSKLINQELDLQNMKASDNEVNEYLVENQKEFSDIFSEGDPALETLFKNKVRQKLTQEKQQQVIKEYIESLRKKANIEMGGGV